MASTARTTVGGSGTVDGPTTEGQLRRTRPVWVPWLAAVVVGLAVGVATSFLQRYLPSPWRALTNSISPWVAPAFVIGTVSIRLRPAVLTGCVTCLAEVTGYYLTTQARGFAVADNEIVIWALAALVGGPVLGAAGWQWSRGSHAWRPVGAAMLPAVFLAEGISFQLRLSYLADAVLYAGIGALLAAFLIWRTKPRRATLLWTLALSAVGVGGVLLAATVIGASFIAT